MSDASSKASLILEVVDLDAYRAAVKAATADTEALTAAQAKVAPIQRAGKKAVDEAAESAKALAKAQNEVEKAYISALAPHEKTRLKLEQTLELQFDSVEMTTKQAVAVAHLSLKLEDQTRRFEMNRGAQHKLSRSLAELLDEQTRAQTAAIAAGAAMLKEGLSSQKLAIAIEHLSATTDDADKKSEAYREQIGKLEGQLRDVTKAEKAQAAAQVAAAHTATLIAVKRMSSADRRYAKGRIEDVIHTKNVAFKREREELNRWGMINQIHTTEIAAGRFIIDMARVAKSDANTQLGDVVCLTNYPQGLGKHIQSLYDALDVRQANMKLEGARLLDEIMLGSPADAIVQIQRFESTKF
jgi:hypothetical protein